MTETSAHIETALTARGSRRRIGPAPAAAGLSAAAAWARPP